MIPLEIHDRGRGPELKGTRLTVYDIIPYREAGRGAATIADALKPGYPDLTPAHIELLFRYIDDHHDEVMAVHREIEERVARGNPPEVREKLKQSRAKLLARLAPGLRARLVGLMIGWGEEVPEEFKPADQPVGG